MGLGVFDHGQSFGVEDLDPVATGEGPGRNGHVKGLSFSRQGDARAAVQVNLAGGRSVVIGIKDNRGDTARPALEGGCSRETFIRLAAHPDSRDRPVSRQGQG